MRRAVRFWLALLMLAVAAPAGLCADQPLVRIITSDFVLPGKINRLADIGAAHGVKVEGLWVENATGNPADWLAGADLVIIDAPRGNDMAKVRDRLGPVLESTPTPWLRVGGGPPGAGNLPPDQAPTLIAYYANGGPVNIGHLFAFVAARAKGLSGPPLPEPERLPKAGFYHAAAPAPFPDAASYLAWGQARWPRQAPRVAIAINTGMLSGMQTAMVDGLVAKMEKAGLAPLPFWFEAGKEDGLTSLLAPAGIDALVNLTHMQNGSARAAELLTLDVPALPAFTWQEGDEASFQAATSGIQAGTMAALLTVPESWGMADPLVIGALRNGEPVLMEAQADTLIAKLVRLAILRGKPAADKHLALMFWNHPEGEKNISASNLNIPRSLEHLTTALKQAGYRVETPDEATLTEKAQAMLGGLYRPEAELSGLLDKGLAQALPLSVYQSWFNNIPISQQQEITRTWGAASQHWALRNIKGELAFIIPVAKLGNLTLMPQPPRAGRPGASYHDTKVPPDHFYLAAYLWLRQSGADALIHFGTHGTQEWTPGKDRGLSVSDYPFLTVGDLPVFYPYIQDNVGEAMQARRRGRAVTISHQTPPFAPAGLYDELRDLHALVHEYQQLEEGAVHDATAARIRDAVTAAHMDKDLGWDAARMQADFPGFMNVLHDHLHVLAQDALPLGLHVFGKPANPDHRLSTVMQQLGPDFYRLASGEPDELFAGDYSQLQQVAPYRLLKAHLRDGVAVDTIPDAGLRTQVERAIALDRNLAQTGEVEALLAGLAGRLMPPGPGGDPIRNPDVPSGRNLYAFEPNKLPTRSAYAAGEKALADLIAAYQAEHQGEIPTKLAFTLWSSEAMRHLGVVESQILWAMGLRPVWDQGGRVTAIEIIPSAELGRRRIDTVLQITSVYRDQFDGFMRLLADAIDRLAALEEPGNVIAANSSALAADLMKGGMAEARARQLAALRLFSNEPGDYGSGLPDAVLDSTNWEQESALAETFLNRLQYAYGADEWGVKLEGTNLFARQLTGVQAAVLSRSSKLHGILSTDHPFEYLGGLSLAVRHLDGQSPSLYIADLRNPTARITGTASFLADELRTRYQNPHWIKAMQAEGYAGALEMLNVANNLFGWQVTDPDSVRADQWQAFHDTYVMDRRELGLNEWFAANNPTAQMQLVERMAEAIRKGYWDASAQTRAELAQRWQELAATAGTQATADRTREFIESIAAGFGLDAGQTGGATTSGDLESVQGQVMRQVQPDEPGGEPPPWQRWAGFALLAGLILAGAMRQRHINALRV
ncbi:cobaltochelatase subunit CobN [Niveispirillum irakense]|uniref:cobaltochelatase subunit CobN n=1 Tax=Niveispirillum irakense TaxID=34011 RepID=UPI0004288EC8|nr:cobaltochelatase subunit CobN [Niveispirillum irakense]